MVSLSAIIYPNLSWTMLLILTTQEIFTVKNATVPLCSRLVTTVYKHAHIQKASMFRSHLHFSTDLTGPHSDGGWVAHRLFIGSTVADLSLNVLLWEQRCVSHLSRRKPAALLLYTHYPKHFLHTVEHQRGTWASACTLVCTDNYLQSVYFSLAVLLKLYNGFFLGFY